MAIPSDLSGLVAWWDAADADTLWTDTAGTTAATTEGAAVARLDDKSGNGYNATQSDAGFRPLLNLAEINGLDALYYDGDWLTTTINPSVTLASGFTVAVVALLDAPANRSWSWIYGEDGAGPYGLFLGKSGNFDGIHFSATDWHNAIDAGSGAIAGAAHLFMQQESPTARSVWLDGAEVASGFNNSSLDMNQTGFALGGRFEIEGWKGPICELVIYDRVLDGAERADVEDYLTAKWGVAMNDHESDTTDVHGIADTALLETVTGSAAKVAAHAAATRTIYAGSPPPPLAAVVADGTTDDSPAIRAQLAYAKATWGGGIVDIRHLGAAIRCATPIGTIPEGVTLRSDPATVIGFADIGKTAGPAAIVVDGAGWTPLDGVRLEGPNWDPIDAWPTDSSIGLSITGNSLTFENIQVNRFGRNIDWAHNDTFIITFRGGSSGYGGVCLYGDIEAAEVGNAGERITFKDFTVFNSKRGFQISGGGQTFHLQNVSVDFCEEFGRNLNARLFVNGGHWETSGAPDPDKYMMQASGNGVNYFSEVEFIGGGVRRIFDNGTGPADFGFGGAEFKLCSAFFIDPDGNARTVKSRHMMWFPPNVTTAALYVPWPLRWCAVTCQFGVTDGGTLEAGIDHAVRVSAMDTSTNQITFTAAAASSVGRRLVVEF